MPDSKNVKWADDYTDEGTSPAAPEPALPSAEPAANDADGWQQYRRWITKAPAPRSRRAGLDPALYTWKGYRTWSEKVKRQWKDEDD
jgi:hypothetical protein